jgi:hypothetical protein
MYEEQEYYTAPRHVVRNNMNTGAQSPSRRVRAISAVDNNSENQNPVASANKKMKQNEYKDFLE